MRSTAAFDFDGTLCINAFPEIGPIGPFQQKHIDTLKQLHENGVVIILWTCRENRPERKYLDEALEFCKQHDIHIDYVNEYPNDDRWPEYGPIIKCKKLDATYYFDDKSMYLGD